MNAKWAITILISFLVLFSGCFEDNLVADDGEKIDVPYYARKGYKPIHCNFARVVALTKPGPDHQFSKEELQLIAKELKTDTEVNSPAYIFTYFFTATPSDIYEVRPVNTHDTILLYIFIEDDTISGFSTERPFDFSKC